MEAPLNLPDDASMSDLTLPPSPHALDAHDPALVGGETDTPAADAPVRQDDPSLVGAQTDTNASESEEPSAPAAPTGPTAGSEMGGDRF